MSKNRFELPTDRLATTDEKGQRVYLYPEDVRGIWRHRRSLFYWSLIITYLVLPWTTFQGKQTILLDIAKREFTLFGQTFFATDLPLLIILLLGGLFLIGFVTSIWGRVWCGWACPQTVFIDALYSKVEILIEGKGRARKALDEGPWNSEKIFKKSLKWTIFLIISLHIAHSFIGYFIGTKELFWMTLRPPAENMGAFITMCSLTLLCLFDFGWFREQFCIIACPYGRLQSVIMDDNSMVVAYDKTRGEPRRSSQIKKEDEGDCINCYHCVKVCPTGIDIRRGTQLECIACTNCIDACDEIMEKTQRPPGLIRYATQTELEGGKTHIWRPRSLIYLLACALIFGSGLFLINRSQEMSFSAFRAVGDPYREGVDSSGAKQIINHYIITIDNKDLETAPSLWFESSDARIEVVSAPRPLSLKKGHTRANVFIKFSPSILNNGSLKSEVIIKSGATLSEAALIKKMEVNLVGPFE